MFIGHIAVGLAVKRAAPGISLGTLVIVLVIFYLANLFGPPPASLKALKVGALCGWLLVPWFYWTDHRRQATSMAESGTDAAL
jgi:hypothetical protein